MAASWISRGPHFLFSHAYLHRTLNTFKILVVQERRGGKDWNFLESVGEWKPSYWQILVRIGSRLLGFPGDHIFFSHTHTYIQTLNIFEILVVQEREGGKGWNLVERLYVWIASGWQNLMRMGSRLPCFPGDHIFSPTHTKPSKHGKSLFCRKGEGERVEIWWRVWVHVQLAAGKIWWESSPSILAFPGTTFFGLWAPKRIHTPFGREGRGGKGWIFLESVRA